METFQVGVPHRVAVLKEVLALDIAAHIVHACNEECELLISTDNFPIINGELFIRSPEALHRTSLLFHHTACQQQNVIC